MNKIVKAISTSSKDLFDMQAFRERWNLTQNDLAMLLPGKYSERQVDAWESTGKPAPSPVIKYMHDMDKELQEQVDVSVTKILNLVSETIPSDTQPLIRLVCYTELEDLVASDLMMGRLGLPGLALHAGISRNVAQILGKREIETQFVYFDAASYKQWLKTCQTKPTHEAWASEQKREHHSLQ